MQHIPGGKGPDSYDGAVANTSMGNEHIQGCPPTPYFLAMQQVLKARAIKMGGKATPPDQLGTGLMQVPPDQTA